MQLDQIIQGNTIELMPKLPKKFFHCCVTSPPYWGLRDYGLPPTEWPEVTYTPMTGVPHITVPTWKGCLGLEPTPEMFVAHMVLVFREVWRVLRDDGTLWMNFGDSYAGSMKGRNSDGQGNPGGFHKQSGGQSGGNINYKQFEYGSLKPKDLTGIPWRVALALQADGWYLRMDNIWSKVNPMPESVEDRPTKAHEYFFLLSKSLKYFYDAEAVKEPAVGTNFVPPAGSQGAFGPDQSRRRKGNAKTFRGGGAYTLGRSFNNSDPVGRESTGNVSNESGLRNRRSVWTVATEQTPEAHFATYPKKLIEPCVLAGSSSRACQYCGASWKRLVEKSTSFQGGSGKAGRSSDELNKSGKWQEDQLKGNKNLKRGPVVDVNTVGWESTCKCKDNDGSGKCVVFDPFMGSGTTAIVARNLGRKFIGTELNQEYIQLAERRLQRETAQMNIFEFGT
ncbi:DNA-methyltransferase [Brevibacillus brevis]|nr:site-specific DNA-methyltransferase [Brevibacillus brevis]